MLICAVDTYDIPSYRFYYIPLEILLENEAFVSFLV